MTEELSRTSALASRHTQLGSALEDWNGMGTAWSYATDPNDEHDAVREAAAMFDMSPLKKIRITGPDAFETLNHLHSRDLARVEPGNAVYGAVLTDTGTVADDAIAFHISEDEWLLVHGSGTTMGLLDESAEDRNVEHRLDDNLHILSVQGPKALGLLDSAFSGALAPLPYFGLTNGRLFGRKVMISRTGYSGERGYEVFTDGAHVGELWDAILAIGQSTGVMPASFAALDKVRVEAALLFYGYDMTNEHYPSEVGLGWAISKNGDDYRGRDAALAAAGNERFTLAGLSIEHSDMINGGETIQLDGKPVGTVNSPAYSQRLAKSLALCHINPAANTPGTRLEIIGDDASYDAVIETIPFFDPNKTRTHAA